jgi:hypothetical protein
MPRLTSLRSCAIAFLGLTLASCVPPREHVAGRSADGRTQLVLDLQPSGGDSVDGTGVLHVAGRPRPVSLRGRWNETGDGLRSLVATLRDGATADSQWTLEWSPSGLNGTLRQIEGGEELMMVTLKTPD